MDDKNKIPCSAVILTLNRREKLERCLKTLADFEEIVVLDGNSTDGTPELAREFGAKVFPQAETEEKNIRIGDFSQVHNKGLGCAKKNWIFDIDSDEYITPELAEEIRNFVDKNDRSKAAAIQRFSVIGGNVIRYAPNYPNYYVRVFARESGAHYIKPVHEELVLPDGVSLVYLKNAVLEPYPPYEICLEKDKHYLDMATAGYIDGGNGLFRKKITPILFFKVSRKILINALKAAKILVRGGVLRLRYGRQAMPVRYVWRFSRYHLLFAGRLISSLARSAGGK